jgi:hypothetical protein
MELTNSVSLEDSQISYIVVTEEIERNYKLGWDPHRIPDKIEVVHVLGLPASNQKKDKSVIINKSKMKEILRKR